MQQRQYLIVRSDQPENAFGQFAAEILKSEGLMGFEAVDAGAAPIPAFRPGNVVLFTRCFLTDAETDAVHAAVAGGAHAVFIQPQQTLAARFGWKPMLDVISPGYVRIRPGFPGAGTPLQTHLPVPRYSAAGPAQDWETIADASGTNWQDTGCPAVVRAAVGQGSVALFFYDLPEAVARIRFGNRDLGSYCTSRRWDWPHACDLFAGHIDGRTLRTPQADLHGQLLAKVLTDACPWPLARLWYYERAAHRSAAVLQSDGDMSTSEQFERLATAVEDRGGTATFYLMRKTRLSEAAVRALRQRGHTFAPHVDPRAFPEELYFAGPLALAEETAAFRQRFGECSTSLQCHCAPWMGHMNWVDAHIRNGYRLLFAYFSGPPENWGGYVCGSGRPLRFVDSGGTQHDCWQQPMVTYDDASVKDKLTNELPAVTAQFESRLQAALTTHHTALPFLSHPVSFCTYSSPFMEHAFDRLREEGVPIYNGDQWCALQDRRNAVRIRQQTVPEGGTHCTVAGLTGAATLMLPLRAAHGNASPRVTVDGANVEGTIERRLEQQYQMVELQGAGSEIEVGLTGPASA